MNLRWKIAQATEIRWWRSYLRNKNVKEYLRNKKAYWQKVLVLARINLKKDDTVLDAGCGPAGIFIILNNNKIDAIDPLLKQYTEQIQHFNPKDYPKVNFHKATLESFSSSKTYDFVFCLNVINHVADLAHSLDQLSIFTRENGTLLISVDAHNYSFLKHLFRWFPGDVLHPHQYDIGEYYTMLSQRGFQIEKQIKLKKSLLFDHYLFVAKKTV